MAQPPDEDRLVKFTKTVELAILEQQAAIAKKVKGHVQTEVQRIEGDHKKRVEAFLAFERQIVNREKQQLLEATANVLSAAVGKDRAKEMAVRFLDVKPEELKSELKSEQSISVVPKTSPAPSSAPAKFMASSSLYDVRLFRPCLEHGANTLPSHQAKRSKTQPDFGTTPVTKRHRVSSDPPPRLEAKQCLGNPGVEDWQIEGVEYVFELQELNTGWIVLRCNLGADMAPFMFTEHPFAAPNYLAEAHFNGADCIGHDSNRKYTKEDIIREFSHKGMSGKRRHRLIGKATAANRGLQQLSILRDVPRVRPGSRLPTVDFLRTNSRRA
ncbi:hypothetical protein B0T21DRAFT_389934 [Apiosordaria backusii]|uniref:Uncharacterized protein n=1 Tax=Apiosordaria backusii TaxID=314023 RepID=A0AA40ESG4_9PEZI|nr:hypothetical protein B0T21DRAFT_389934 [Apiosordaria backusii]